MLLIFTSSVRRIPVALPRSMQENMEETLLSHRLRTYPPFGRNIVTSFPLSPIV